ncbi:CotO family spore coat protein [Metabacillus fastidiosus]|uniref:CotO family spore coat protein n=1 Tax=Metabacillus fastidiosus TaxID=1458 RepID=UPI000824CF3C|nr:CotO family spore coat protein [Metabacillus fastidiosus]MED4461645.1 CotO family spore coat protein [Metabacillus fastidiosus]
MSKIKNDYSAKPLLYIIQPEQEGIQAKMQALVIKKPQKQVEEREVESIEAVEEKPEMPIETPSIIENVEVEKIKEDIEEEQEKPKKKRRERKSISEMSIPEKVQFFKALPKTMPKSLCLIETNEVKYRGLIMGEENGIVTIRSLQHSDAVTIHIDEIKAISILGF